MNTKGQTWNENIWTVTRPKEKSPRNNKQLTAVIIEQCILTCAAYVVLGNAMPSWCHVYFPVSGCSTVSLWLKKLPVSYKQEMKISCDALRHCMYYLGILNYMSLPSCLLLCWSLWNVSLEKNIAERFTPYWVLIPTKDKRCCG